MSKKKREPFDLDALLMTQQTEHDLKLEDFERPGVCMLPANHRDMMKDERPRAEKDAKEG